MDKETMDLIKYIATFIGGGGIVGLITLLTRNSFKKGVQETKVFGLENRIDKLPCDKNTELLNNVEKKLTMLEGINNMVMGLRGDLQKQNIEHPILEHVAVKNSPLKITTIGEIVYEKIKAKDTVDKHMDFLIFELEKLSPKTAFDVENKLESMLYGIIDKKEFDEVKNFLYVSPETITVKDPDGKEISISLSLSMAISLMGIKIGEEYMIRHPEIKEKIENI